MRAYYNEFDPFAAAWLRELIADGLIAPGDVDDRSITDVSPADLVGYTQCHFFAGIGGWSYALRLAGWPDDRPVWTGSCPCQPFSTAGRRRGTDDPRHLWPEFCRLLRESRPDAVFGEQVSSAFGWLDLVCGDLEGEGYAVGAAIVGAHSVGAPHLRQRLYWVADTDEQGPQGRGVRLGKESNQRMLGAGGPWDNPNWVPCRDGKWRPVEPGTFPLAHGVPARVGRLRGYGNAIVPQVAAAFVMAYLDSLVPLDESPRGV